jgi:hypothetical protein
MKMLQLLLGALTLLLAACSPSPEVPFSRDGVSFTCPQGWKITDEEDLDGLGYSLSVEKDGFSSSGLAMINWILVPMDEQTYMETYQDELGANVIYKNANLAFSDTESGTYAKLPTLTSSYTASILGVDHRGTLHIFKRGGKTFTVCLQEAIEDIDKNAPGFEKIESTFIVDGTDE